MIIFFDKPYHTYFISSADYLCHAYKLHHEDIAYQILNCDDMVMLLPFEAKKHPLEDNSKVALIPVSTFDYEDDLGR